MAVIGKVLVLLAVLAFLVAALAKLWALPIWYFAPVSYWRASCGLCLLGIAFLIWGRPEKL